MSVHFAESGSGGGKPSGVDLAAFASRANEIEVGGGDDIVELGDDLGLNLLSNPNKVAASPRRPVALSGGFGGSGGSSSGPSFGSGGGMPTLQIKPVDDLDIVDLDAAPGAADISINRQAEPAPFVIHTGDGSASAGAGGGGYSEGGAVATGNGLSPEEEARQKQGYLTKLQRLEANGLRGQRMTMSHSLEEIKAEYDKLTDSRNLEASIRFQRNALMTFVTGVEMVNDKFGQRLPVKPRLKGWSESVHTNIEDFDEIFEELYDMYKDKTKMHPMLRLVGTLGVSATMYHLTNSAAEKSGVPGMAELLHENPELQRQFAAAMAAKMGGGLGNFMSAASGFAPGPPSMPMSGGAGPSPMGYGVPPPSPPRREMPADTRVPFHGGSEPARARREMRGPSGVDDILRAFEAERAISGSGGNPVADHHAGVFAPSGAPPPSARGVSILREGVGSGADPMAEFLAGGGDDGSVGTMSTMNSERRRGRRRAAATPVGATLDLNV
jgi:hypothetical protein